MNDISFRQFFRPVQPSIKLKTGDVQYKESIPDPRLRNFIYCYWQLRSGDRLSSSLTYRVIPDGCIDIFFDMSNLDDSRIMGFTSKPTEFDLGSSFEYVGVRFMPAAFPYLFNIDASILTERDESLSDVVPLLKSRLTDTLFNTRSFSAVGEAFDRYFIKELETRRISIDKRLHNAVHLILKHHGHINMLSDLDTGISPRQLRRLFEFYVGDTPKVFSKVVRFQYFFQLSSSHKIAAHNKIFLDAGYYDQPHFNKEFKNYFGLTPTQVFSR